MSAMPDPRFEVRRVAESEWLLLDHRYRPDDPRKTVACIYQLDAVEVEVQWLRDLPLARYYMTPADVLEEVRRFYRPSRARRPVPIAHRPPLAPTA